MRWITILRTPILKNPTITSTTKWIQTAGGTCQTIQWFQERTSRSERRRKNTRATIRDRRRERFQKVFILSSRRCSNTRAQADRRRTPRAYATVAAPPARRVASTLWFLTNQADGVEFFATRPNPDHQTEARPSLRAATLGLQGRPPTSPARSRKDAFKAARRR